MTPGGRVRVLADSAEKADEIDLARAEESRKRALDRLSHPLADMDTARALNALKRAQARVEANAMMEAVALATRSAVWCAHGDE